MSGSPVICLSWNGMVTYVIIDPKLLTPAAVYTSRKSRRRSGEMSSAKRLLLVTCADTAWWNAVAASRYRAQSE
ncbi:hypothetical protein Cme02nite_21590 [Catellatospora methionotrophica]|uniref:Uncharacterized protein n=1 Tax=Catellatospora methionotrophica TaxID=121620 RepID=A0A8J3L3E3_9ACTN|nr:hypothetical protein Cme02nite_21590 [Catellatospora methionotrophica]